jgi:tetratricopeptide (TPR) repeat protein
MLDDNQGALEDLDKADVLKPNDAFTLSVRGAVKKDLDDYQGALEDLNKADDLKPNDAFTLSVRGDVKRMLDDNQGALEDLDKADDLAPNDALTLSVHGDVKRMLDDYQGALEDLDKADDLEPNDAFTLCVRGDVKRMLHDYQGALEDLDKADDLEPNDAFTLRVRGDVKRMLEDYQGALEDFNKANVLQLNDAFILTAYVNTNWSLNKYQAALEAIDKLHSLRPNDDYILQTRKWLKWMLDEYQPIIESLPFNSNIQSFTYDDLNFENELNPSLGRGAYGEVYQSCWKGITIAIKVLEWSGDHNEGAKKSFISEVNTLGSIQHINLVRLLGYCIEGLKHILVYEYISNSSLDKWLHGDKRLDWDKRICIIIGVARGLAHLHHNCDPTIVHLDIKPGNILLDKDYTPKLADFGLAKILHGRDENVVCAPPFFFG